LEQGTLDKMAQRMLERETLPSIAAEVDLDAYDRKVIANFTDANGRIKTLPAQRKSWKRSCVMSCGISSRKCDTLKNKSTKSCPVITRYGHPAA